MSALAGIWNRDGKPVLPEEISGMLNSLAYRGPDGCGVWREGAVALGHRMMHITPESLRERLPWHDPVRRLTITADARLDNRDDLCDILGIPPGERRFWSDSGLILGAFSKWDTDCANYLLGDFSFVIWDPSRQRTVCVTDHLGLRPVFYYCDANRFAFASEPKAIFTLDGISRRLNERRLAEFGLFLVNQFDKQSTYYLGINRIPPTTVMTVTATGVAQRRYWEPDPSRRLPYKTDRETLEALRELIISSVAARMRSAFPVSALLSGGLDSSAVVGAAACVLEKTGGRLTTISAVLPEERAPGLTDERRYTEHFKSWRQLDMVYVSADGRGPFDEIERLVREAETPFIGTRHYLETALWSAAAERGSRVVLSGIGGEFGVTNLGTDLLYEYFLRGRWLALSGAISALARVERKPAWRLFGSHVVRPLLPDSLCNLLRTGRMRTPDPWDGNSPFQSAFVRRHLQEGMHLLAAQLHRCHRTAADHRENLRRAIQHLCGLWPQNIGIGSEKVSLAFPLADKRILEFCLAAPGHLKLREGHSRGLVRGAMDGLVPPAIQWRTDKTPFSPDYVQRFRSQSPGIRDWLEAIPPGDPVRRIVDVDNLRRMIAAVAATDANDPKQLAMHAVPWGVYLICFLRQFD